MRMELDGFFDRAAQNGPVTGSGPGFEKAMRKFLRRQDRASRVGKWRCVDSRRKNPPRSDGTFIDRDWDIIDY